LRSSKSPTIVASNPKANTRARHQSSDRRVFEDALYAIDF
jgi:hypothetical protein